MAGRKTTEEVVVKIKGTLFNLGGGDVNGVDSWRRIIHSTGR